MYHIIEYFDVIISGGNGPVLMNFCRHHQSPFPLVIGMQYHLDPENPGQHTFHVSDKATNLFAIQGKHNRWATFSNDVGLIHLNDKFMLDNQAKFMREAIMGGFFPVRNVHDPEFILNNDGIHPKQVQDGETQLFAELKRMSPGWHNTIKGFMNDYKRLSRIRG